MSSTTSATQTTISNRLSVLSVGRGGAYVEVKTWDDLAGDFVFNTTRLDGEQVKALIVALGGQVSD